MLLDRDAQPGAAGGSSEPTLLEIVEAHPGVLAVLDAFGISIDPWTLIALRCSITQLAEYSAVRDPRELREAIERAIRD